MRAPKAIRSKRDKIRKDALVSYGNDRALGLLDKTGKTAKGFSLNGRSVNIGFRVSPDMNQGFRFRQPMNAKGVTNKPRKSDLRDNDLYSQGTRILVEGQVIRYQVKDEAKADKSSKVRVGTTPSHMVPITDQDTGETKLVRVRAKGKYQDVGLPGCKPLDGGKET